MVVRVFSRESEMTEAAIANAQGLAAPDAYEVFLEFESTNGMPDLVFARFDAAAERARAGTPLGRAFPDAGDAAVLLALDHARACTVDEVATSARLARSTVVARLRALALDACVERISRSEWRRVGPLPGRLQEAVAAELKLRDWRRALNQAARYRAFAERAWVVVDADRAAGAITNEVAFSFNAIGLAALSAWGELETLVAPAPTPPFDPVARFVAGERLWLELAARQARPQVS